MKTKIKETLAELITDFTRRQPVTLDSVLITSESMRGPLTETGHVVEIDEATYDRYVNVLPPHFTGCGFFCVRKVRSRFDSTSQNRSGISLAT